MYKCIYSFSHYKITPEPECVEATSSQTADYFMYIIIYIKCLLSMMHSTILGTGDIPVRHGPWPHGANLLPGVDR